MRGPVLIAILLIVAGFLSLPFLKEPITRLLLVVMLGGGFVILVLALVGGVVLVAIRGATGS
jgi:hypothetical protein